MPAVEVKARIIRVKISVKVKATIIRAYARIIMVESRVWDRS